MAEEGVNGTGQPGQAVQQGSSGSQTLNVGSGSLGLKSDAFHRRVGRWDAIVMDLGISDGPLLYLLFMLIITS